MKHDMYELPESLYEFAQINDFHGVIEDLAAMAEDEDWKYHKYIELANIRELHSQHLYSVVKREKSCVFYRLEILLL